MTTLLLKKEVLKSFLFYSKYFLFYVKGFFQKFFKVPIYKVFCVLIFTKYLLVVPVHYDKVQTLNHLHAKV